MKIEIDINLKDLKDAVIQAALEGFKEELKRVVGPMKCSIHKKRAGLRIQGNSLENISVQVSGCCDEFIKKVEDKIQED